MHQKKKVWKFPSNKWLAQSGHVLCSRVQKLNAGDLMVLDGEFYSTDRFTWWPSNSILWCYRCHWALILVLVLSFFLHNTQPYLKPELFPWDPFVKKSGQLKRYRTITDNSTSPVKISCEVSMHLLLFFSIKTFFLTVYKNKTISLCKFPFEQTKSSLIAYNCLLYSLQNTFET